LNYFPLPLHLNTKPQIDLHISNLRSLHSYTLLTLKYHHPRTITKFYGPFEILAKVGTVAYQLNLPVDSLIQPVFHVSPLKKKIGPIIEVQAQMPLVGPGSQQKEEPEAILQRCLVKKHNQPAVQVLVKWTNIIEENATWKYYKELGMQFPNFCLDDKQEFEEGVLSVFNTDNWLEPLE
jgi:hypothetical protein